MATRRTCFVIAHLFDVSVSFIEANGETAAVLSRRGESFALCSITVGETERQAEQSLVSADAGRGRAELLPHPVGQACRGGDVLESRRVDAAFQEASVDDRRLSLAHATSNAEAGPADIRRIASWISPPAFPSNW